MENATGCAKCEDILLDTGSHTIVTADMIPLQSHTGKIKIVRSYNGITQSHPIARVVVQVDRKEEEMEVLVADLLLTLHS